MMSIKISAKLKFSLNYVNRSRQVRQSRRFFCQIEKEKNIFIRLAVAADGFNLYLVDETGLSMRLFNPENDE